MADGDSGGRPVDPLHPNGRCMCHGEGRCAWCQNTCSHGVKMMDLCLVCDDEATEEMKRW